MNRRGFLGAMLAACAAPAIVRADSLMRIVPRDTLIAEFDFSLLTPQIITREALRILQNQLSFAVDTSILAPDVFDELIAPYAPVKTILIRKPRRFALEAA